MQVGFNATANSVTVTQGTLNEMKEPEGFFNGRVVTISNESIVSLADLQRSVVPQKPINERQVSIYDSGKA